MSWTEKVLKKRTGLLDYWITGLGNKDFLAKNDICEKETKKEIDNRKEKLTKIDSNNARVCLQTNWITGLSDYFLDYYSGRGKARFFPSEPLIMAQLRPFTFSTGMPGGGLLSISTSIGNCFSQRMK